MYSYFIVSYYKFFINLYFFYYIKVRSFKYIIYTVRAVSQSSAGRCPK